MKNRKADIVTFKADGALLGAMKGIENRSQFIRGAILAALDNACPLCMGTGVLTAGQKVHWQAFAEHHALKECPDCHETHLTCSRTANPGQEA